MTFYRRNLPHLQRDDKPHFVTFVTRQRWQMPEWARELVLSSCIHGHRSRYDLKVAVVMPDHVHMIVVPLVDMAAQAVVPLATITKDIKSYTAHVINSHIEQRGAVWQEESFDHVLRSSESLEEKIHYILQNPVRRGLVIKAGDYKWSWCAEFVNPYRPD